MQLNITGHQIDLTDSLQSYIRERHSDQITQTHVVLNIEKLSHQAEATAHVPGAELFANAEASDMYAAIDQLLDKLDRQLIKHKEKTVARHNGRNDRLPNHTIT